jgi:hypothetical protein
LGFSNWPVILLHQQTPTRFLAPSSLGPIKFSGAVAGVFLHQLYFPPSTWHHKTASNKLLPQTRSLELDYSLFIALMMVLTSKRVEKRPGATPAAFPPPIFAGIASISVFRVSLAPQIAIIKGALYIGIFRSG